MRLTDIRMPDRWLPVCVSLCMMALVLVVARPAAATTTTLLESLGYSGSNAGLVSAGFEEVVVAANWAAIEPSEGVVSASAITSLQNTINTATASGLQVALDIGTQYAPSWIFGVGGGTRFVDQYGDVFGGSPGSGNDVANAVTDSAVRTQLGDYINYLGTHLTGVSAVRLGGLADNELRYPSGTSGSKPDAFWFYDASSQALLPPSARGWVPGTGTVAQATTFLGCYNAAMVNFSDWLETVGQQSFHSTTHLEMMMPGWGDRPGEIGTAQSNLLVNTPDEINEGLDWADLRWPATSQVVAYTTYADAIQGTPSNPDPAAYIHSLLPAGMGSGGEPTGNGQTTPAGENLMFQDARAWDWYAVTWYFPGQSQTAVQVGTAWADSCVLRNPRVAVRCQ